MPKVIYLAGPLFTQGERNWNDEFASALRATGYSVIVPQEQAAALIKRGEQLSATLTRSLFESAIQGVRDADVVVAILDGSDADSGTSFECGYAFALKKPIVGVRTDLRSGGDSPTGGVNLMLAEGCHRLVWLGLESIGQGMEFVADHILKALRELDLAP